MYIPETDISQALGLVDRTDAQTRYVASGTKRTKREDGRTRDGVRGVGISISS